MSQPSDNKAVIARRVKTLLMSAIADLQKKIKLNQYLSANMPYDYHYLSAVFSQEEEMTIEQYFITLKIDKIKELLKDGKLSISEISYRCGYSSPAHLTNQFKKATGKTPSAFQKNLYNDEENEN